MKSTKAALARRADDWRTQMSTPSGRRIVWELLGQAGIFRPNFSSTPDGGMNLAFREGERNIGLFIVRSLEELVPGSFATMLAEARTPAKTSGTHNATPPEDTAGQ